jgi:ATP-dependent Lon protease
MARDSQNKLSTREQNKRSKKQEELRKKKNENSDSDGNEGSDSENEEMDMHEFRKYIQKMFPSKYLADKIKSGEKLKKKLHDSNDEESDEEEIISKKTNKKSIVTKGKTKKLIKNNRKKVVESDSESEDDWETESEQEKVCKKNKKTKHNRRRIIESESDDEDYEEEDDGEEEDEELAVKGSNKLNIIFTIGGGQTDDEEEWIDEDDSEFEGYEDIDDETEDEDESVSTDESEEEDDDDEEEEISNKKKSKKQNKKNVLTKGKKSKNIEKEKEKDKDDNTCENENEKTSHEVLCQLKDLLNKNPNDKSIQKCIEVYENDIKKENDKKEKKEKKYKAKNLRIFRKIVKDKNTMNDFSFYDKLEVPEQKKIIKELREINKITRIEKPYRMTLLESDIPVQFKAAAMKKINSLRYMEPGSGEFYKIKNWVDTFMRIPFGKNEGLPISIDDGVEKCHEFMENAQKTLDTAVYGLNDAKMQIMQMLGQLLTNPKAIGTAIAIHGPPGTGKTSLVKEGISKILNRPFAFIALGGATDSSFLEGHGYTYEGSTWGKIVQILIDSKCMNPVIYFDELDKISDTPRGEEIAGILTHLTDTSQNSQFHDKYFAEINFDLSKCLFIFSYNDETKVNAILKDRMYRIKTKGYSGKEKTVITNSYLLPRIREQVKFNEDEIIIPDATISYIVDSQCDKEDGVRNLKRCLEIIYTKLNLYRLMKPNSNLFEKDMALKVEFPFIVTKDIVDKLIKRDNDNLAVWRSMYL